MTAIVPALATHFGQGRHEPYARALHTGSGKLTLRPVSIDRPAEPVEFEVGSWCEEATFLEKSLLSSLQGPVLDIGCGPGRMLTAARALGLQALGIDTSAAAVRRARQQGNRALEQSIFAVLPYSGHWESMLLIDGNIGIGGNVTSLLRRCRQIIAPSGTLLVEVDTDHDLDAAYRAVLEDGEGNRSDAFSWARIGGAGLDLKARSAGWIIFSAQHLQGRVFYRLSPRLERRSVL